MDETTKQILCIFLIIGSILFYIASIYKIQGYVNTCQINTWEYLGPQVWKNIGSIFLGIVILWITTLLFVIQDNSWTKWIIIINSGITLFISYVAVYASIQT
jgi:hypothetical protein